MSPQVVTKVTIFISSPSDVTLERDAVKSVIEHLSEPDSLAEHFGLALQVLDWRKIVGELGPPQDIIFKSLPVGDWDIYVGILWSRFGTPTGNVDPRTGEAFESGTQEEFSLAHQSWDKVRRPKVLFYRCTRDYPQSVDPPQLQLVKEFFSKYPGIWIAYKGVDSGVDNFKDRFRNDLEKLLVKYGREVILEASPLGTSAPPFQRLPQRPPEPQGGATSNVGGVHGASDSARLTFSAWLPAQHLFYLITAGFAALVAFSQTLRSAAIWREFPTMTLKGFDSLGWDKWLLPGSFALQFLVILLLVLFLPVARIDRVRYQRASTAAQQFIRYWGLLWLLWLIFYSFFTLESVMRVVQPQVVTAWQDLTGILENLINNLPTLAIGVCYGILSAPTVDTDDSKSQLYLKGWTSVVLLLTALEIAFTIIGSTQPYAHIAFRWVGGVLAGVTLALFVGRLDSKIIDPPRIMIIFLYFYAVIQAGFIDFPEKPFLTVILINIALIAKLFLYFFVFWLLDSGLLLFYFEKIRNIDAVAPRERSEFVKDLAARLLFLR